MTTLSLHQKKKKSRRGLGGEHGISCIRVCRRGCRGGEARAHPRNALPPPWEDAAPRGSTRPTVLYVKLTKNKKTKKNFGRDPGDDFGSIFCENHRVKSGVWAGGGPISDHFPITQRRFKYIIIKPDFPYIYMVLRFSSTRFSGIQ